MAFNMSLLATPTADTAGSTLFLYNETSTYVFGHVPEALQRVVRCRSVPWTRLNQTYFLSGTAQWETIGGLPGMLFSLAESRTAVKASIADMNTHRTSRGLKSKALPSAELPVHGPDNMCHLMASLRPLLVRQPLKVSLHEQKLSSSQNPAPGREPDWNDMHVRVWKVPVQKARPGSPWKRRHSADDQETDSTATHDSAEGGSPSNDSTMKPRAGTSDPCTAQWIVEHGMLDGTTDSSMFLTQKKASELAPTEEAWQFRNGALTPYERAADTEDVSELNKMVLIKTNSYKDGNIDLRNRDLPRTSYGEICMSYILKTRDFRGKFDPVAAKAKGVLPSQFAGLCKGESVVTQSGETVTPEMVLGQSVPGKGIIVADIPTPSLVETFFERPEWSDSSLLEHVVVMYWFLGKGLYNNTRILDYMKAHPGIRHVVCAPETTPNAISLSRAADIVTQLHRLDPERFPVIKYDNEAAVKLPEQYPAVIGDPQETVTIMPALKTQHGGTGRKLDLVDAMQRVPKEAVELAKQAEEKIKDAAFQARVEEEEKDIPSRDAEIICLGTSSSNPSDVRGLCGTLIRAPGIGTYLLDCGEGVLAQLRRSYGDEDIGKVLSDLKCIVISHAHGDHVLGVVSMLKAWYQNMLEAGDGSTKLAIACSARLKMMIAEISQADDFGFHRLVFPVASTAPYNNGPDKDATASELENGAYGLESIKRIPVTHCQQSYGTQLELTSGLRIAWSGDCRPSDNFADACKGAHLLIHESTFDNEDSKHAKEKNHSTISDALGVAERMEARRTVLTHFSTRYKGTTKGLEERNGAVLLGWDFMRVKLGDFQKAAQFLPAIELLRDKVISRSK
ncbi:beta-lactamase superfamily protein [Sarocladium implicatum]|nr:beta-lactamase superfamily protein [Sarocladium implicatum]